jgi:hypothetical protein
MQGFGEKNFQWCQLKVHHFAKIPLARPVAGNISPMVA